MAYDFIHFFGLLWYILIFNFMLWVKIEWTYEKSVFTPGIMDHITCNKYWWRNILYINNWYPFNEMCMIWSWYLANDMQLYVVAIILLVLSMRFMKTSVFLLALITLCSWITSIYFSILHNYSYKVAEPFGSFDILYDKPWQRITPYIMGMLTGYIIYFKKTPPKVSGIVNLLLWITSVSIIFGLIFGVWDGQLSVPATAVYVSLGHTDNCFLRKCCPIIYTSIFYIFVARSTGDQTFETCF
uniref:Nose resistant to fluoxetine protein 6 n=1 Tax=Culex pipiens TaxID=7175 RepID=A0A8D8FJ14_CULPI